MALRSLIHKAMEINWHDFISPVVLSIRVAFFSSLIVFLLGIAVAASLAGKHFKGKSLLETLFILPLVLPPSVVGFLLLVCFGRKGWLGEWLQSWFHISIIFTWWGAVIAAVIVSFPLVYQTLKVGFASVDMEVMEAARCQGAGNWQVLRYILLPLSLRSLKSGYMLGFARSLGEFGATIMIAGNIPGRTQTIPTAIFGAVDAGHLSLAWAWSSAIVVISFLMLWVANLRLVSVER
jgi:molybdate transport system permease protein